MNNLTIGTEIYDSGDRANIPYFGKIVEIEKDKFGIRYQVKKDDGSLTIIDSYLISPKYLNNGLSRIVTKASYDEWKENAIKEFNNRYNNRYKITKQEASK